MKAIIVYTILALSLSSCCTIKQVETSDKQEVHKEVEARYHRDSIYVERKDSIFMLVKGDSVFIDRWHMLYKYRDVMRRDTFIKNDSVYVDRYVSKVKELSKWQVFWCQFGKVAAAIFLLLLLIFIFRRK